MPSSNEQKRVVVAGATGYLGGYVAQALHEAGYRVRALARDEGRLERIRSSSDEVFRGEATRAESISGLFDGADAAFSSIGIRHARRRPTFWEVDCGANLALVEAARRAGVKTFVFVSVFRGEQLRRSLAIAEARERVVDALRTSGMRWLVLRPTSFFNDAADFFKMARQGRVWLVGDGSTCLNPIHGADLAAEVVRLLAAPERDLARDYGGPNTFTLREMGEIAFRVLGKRPRFVSIPACAVRAFAALARPFNENLSALASGLAMFSQLDGVAHPTGTHHLSDFYRELART